MVSENIESGFWLTDLPELDCPFATAGYEARLGRVHSERENGTIMYEGLASVSVISPGPRGEFQYQRRRQPAQWEGPRRGTGAGSIGAEPAGAR